MPRNKKNKRLGMVDKGCWFWVKLWITVFSEWVRIATKKTGFDRDKNMVACLLPGSPKDEHTNKSVIYAPVMAFNCAT